MQYPRKDKIGEAMVGGDNKGVLLEGNLTFRKQLDH